MAKILVVEDDDLFRDTLKTALLRDKHEVEVCGDGKTAQHVLGVRKFDLILSDIRIPNMNGLELLSWVKNTLKTPIILMSGFSDALEKLDLNTLGAAFFLPKPFNDKDLKEAIRKTLEPQKVGDEHLPDLDHEFCKLSIDDFVMGSEIPFTIFIRISAKRYVLVAYKGEDISVERIRLYKQKNVNHLYMKKDDFRNCVKFNLDLARRVTQSEKVTAEKKDHFLRYTGELVMEQLHQDEVDSESLVHAQDYIKTVLSVVSDSNDIFTLLDALNEHSDFLYAHSVGVSMYAVMIGKNLKWHSLQTNFKLALGGLLHDVGKKEVDRAILEKRRVSLNQKERTMIETHPRRGVEILSAVSEVPSDVLEMVGQHHEDNIGTGFPAGLRKSSMHPFARVVSVANIFCEFVIKTPSMEPLGPMEALWRMQTHQAQLIDQEAFGALKSLFGISADQLVPEPKTK